jgi:ABC-type transport system substrate-binding protein
VLAPHRLEIQFARAPLRAQALLHREIRNPSTGEPETPFFKLLEGDDSRATFVRHVPEPEDVETYHVAQIEEISYPDRSSMLKALLRGETDLLTDVALQHVNALRDHPSWETHQYALPRTHLIQFHPSSLPFRSPELRRALLFAINREDMLDQIVLRDLPKQWGRIVTAPFATRSYAYSPQSRAVVPDMRVGLSLALAAARNNDNTLPELRMIAPPDDELKPILDEIIERWRRIGLQVRLLDDEESRSGEWDLAYRTIVMPEPLVELWPFLTLRDSARVVDLQLLPGWLRQQLIELDLITSWDDAASLLHRIHENLWEEVFYIPLWETERFLVHRRGIFGIPQRPVHAYDSLETWTIDPWFDQVKP